jgi:signal transduction histidine kinase
VIFGLTVFLYDFGGLVILARKTLSSRGEERVRRLYLLAGLAVMLILIVIFNFILPSAFSDTRFIPFATVFIFPFIATASYAIIKHRLLDIRAAVARSVAYLLSLSCIGLAYGLIIFSLSSVLTIGRNFSIADQRILYVGLALVTALTFPYTKRFFDRITNRLFFRDAYDPQLFIDQLNKVFVSDKELESLLVNSSAIIEKNLKSEFCVFYIRKTAYADIRIIGGNPFNLKTNEAQVLEQNASYLRRRVVITDDLAESQHNKSLYEVLQDHNIAALIRLASTHNTSTNDFLLLAPKKSGNPYSTQDIKIIQIIANELVIAVENALHFEQIQRFNVTLQQRVDDATRKLRETNRRLKLLDETKDDFISMASHQLRTPLTSVKGYISLVLDGDAGPIPTSQRKLLSQAFFSSQRMAYLIADLLNVSRLRTGKFLIEPSPVNLANIIEDEINQLHETAESRQLTIEYHKPAHFPTLELDETKTRQVIMNFIDNAIYYTPANGHIEVKLTEKEKSVELQVIDSGIGVPRAEQHRLFTKFYRAKNAQRARPDGTGLGLFMAKKVIVAQGGAIIFRSEEGKGSTFGFTFPKAKLESSASLQNTASREQIS